MKAESEKWVTLKYILPATTLPASFSSPLLAGSVHRLPHWSLLDRLSFTVIFQL